MFKWATAEIIHKQTWNQGLISIRVRAPKFDFIPGQFVRVGVKKNGDIVHRAYSIASSIADDYFEFFMTSVEGGEVSPLIYQLKVGDSLYVNQHAGGFFTLENVPNSESLWLMSTGTGLGPYISMLRTSSTWERFNKIILVHAVRYQADLAYSDMIAQWQQNKGAQLCYIPIVSRETSQNALKGRIPALIRSGQLEDKAQIPINEKAQILLCGNPAMIHETKDLLAERGLHLNMRRRPGHVTLEQYWRPEDEPTKNTAPKVLQSTA